MGTSSHNSGQSGHSPLVPSWVDNESVDSFLLDVDLGRDINRDLSGIIAPNAEPSRFANPKGYMTRFAGSGIGGSDGNLRSAVSQYVRMSTGGAKNAVLRLGSARNSTVHLIRSIGAFSSGGVTGVQQYLKVYNLEGKRADEALRNITDLICPDGGTTNEGIVRDAYIDTIADIPDLRLLNFEDLTLDQLMIVLQGCITRVVIGKLLNDIGNKVLNIPESLLHVLDLKDRMITFVKGIVNDAFLRLGIHANNIYQQDAYELTNQVFEQVYAIFEEADS